MPPRRFPPPWTVDEMNDACFIVRDKKSRSPADGNPGLEHPQLAISASCWLALWVFVDMRRIIFIPLVLCQLPAIKVKRKVFNPIQATVIVHSKYGTHR